MRIAVLIALVGCGGGSGLPIGGAEVTGTFDGQPFEMLVAKRIAVRDREVFVIGGGLDECTIEGAVGYQLIIGAPCGPSLDEMAFGADNAQCDPVFATFSVEEAGGRDRAVGVAGAVDLDTITSTSATGEFTVTLDDDTQLAGTFNARSCIR